MEIFRRLFRDVGRAFVVWRSRNPALLAAGLAYFALFSLIPLTVLTIAVAGHLFAGTNARDMVIAELGEIFSPEAAQSISLLLGRVERSAGPASAASVVVLSWVGSRLFIQLQLALTAVWDIVPPRRTRLGRVKAFLGDRLRALAATVGFGLLAFVFFLIDVILAYFRDLLATMVPPIWMYRILPAFNIVAALVLFTLAFAMIYRWLPAAHPGWPAVWSGAVLASLLFFLGRLGMSFYLHRRNLLSLFGAAGSVAVILVWVYYSMQILLFGATFAAVVGERKQNPLRTPVDPTV
jgi:membrane protein